MTLWSIDARIQEIVAGLAQSTLEEDRQTWLARFEEAAGELETKLDHWASAITHLEAMSKARSEEAARMAALAKSDETKAARMRETLKEYFVSRGLDRIDTPRHRLSVVKQGGNPPIRLSLPAEELPPTYRRTTINVSADIEVIRKALLRGETVSGASLGERGTSLKIR